MNSLLSQTVVSKIRMIDGNELCIMDNSDICLIDRDGTILNTVSAEDVKRQTRFSFAYSHNTKYDEGVFWIGALKMNARDVSVDKFLPLVSKIKEIRR